MPDNNKNLQSLADEASSSSEAIATLPQKEAQAPEWRPTPRLYAIIFGLGLANLLAALENTVVAIAAPVILTDLDLDVDFIWVTNAFFLCSTAMQPLFGQFCNVFGRRLVMLLAIAIFLLGSGICGGASSGGMLIAGRAVQGTGSGGIILVTSIIISDLVPLRQRGSFSALLMSIFGVGSALGPFIGGAIVSGTSWRWVFYMNLPIGAAAWIWLFVFLRVNYNKEMTFVQKVRTLDLVGNGVLIGSTVSVLYALSYAGTLYEWSSWHTLVPLLVGFAGLGLFAFLQRNTTLISKWSVPLMPGRFFKHPTSLIICVNTFLSSAIMYWCLFFLPVYFQAVKLYSPKGSGVALLPFSLLGIPGSMLGGIALVKWGRYKPIHVVAFALQVLGLGLFTLQREETSRAEWAVFQCILSLGGGMIFTTMLPAFQAFLHQRDLAACTAAWYFIRFFGNIWGVAIPAAIFNNKVDHLLAQGLVTNAQAVGLLEKGGAYEAASALFVERWDAATQAQIRAVYRLAIQRVFQIAIAFAGLAFLLSLLEKEVELRRTLDTEFGLEEGEKKKAQDAEKGESSDSS